MHHHRVTLITVARWRQAGIVFMSIPLMKLKLLVLVVLFPTIAFGQIGEVSALRGSAGVLRDGQPQPLALGTVVFLSDTVVVAEEPQDSQVEIRLTDDSLLRIDAGAELLLINYDPNEPDGVLDLIQGHVWLEVQKTFSQRRNAFRVRTRHGVAGVQGTRFGIDTRVDRTLFKVFEGTVEVRSRDGSVQVILGDDDSLVLNARGVVSP